MTTPRPIPASRKGQPVPASLLRVAAEGPQVFERTHDGTLFVSSQYIAAYAIALQEAARAYLTNERDEEKCKEARHRLRALLPEGE